MQVGLTCPPPVAIDEDALLAEWLPKAEAMARKRRLEDPEDAAANVLFAVWRNGYFKRWDPEGGCSMNTWIFRIVEKRMVDEERKQGRIRDRQTLFGGASGDDEDGPLQHDVAHYEEGYSRLDTGDLYERLAALVPDPVQRQLLDSIVESANAGEAPQMIKLAAEIGTATTTARKRLQDLADTLWSLPEAREMRRQLAIDHDAADEEPAELVEAETFARLPNRDLRPLVAAVLIEAKVNKSLSYYLSKAAKCEVLAAAANGSPLEPHLEAGRDAYWRHQENLKVPAA